MTGAKPNAAGKQAPSKREAATYHKKTATTTTGRKTCSRPKHNHSKIATDLFKDWFYANMSHPFPSDDVKADFADRTGSPMCPSRL